MYVLNHSWSIIFFFLWMNAVISIHVTVTFGDDKTVSSFFVDFSRSRSSSTLPNTTANSKIKGFGLSVTVGSTIRLPRKPLRIFILVSLYHMAPFTTKRYMNVAFIRITFWYFFAIERKYEHKNAPLSPCLLACLPLCVMNNLWVLSDATS